MKKTPITMRPIGCAVSTESRELRQMKRTIRRASDRIAPALERLGMDEKKLLQCWKETQPVGLLEQHLLKLAHTDEERRAVDFYCFRIAFHEGGTRTERGRMLLAAGFEDGRGIIVSVLEQMRATGLAT